VLPDDDQLLIETCRSVLSVFNVWHFKLMFYYIEVHLLDHYTQWIKMHGETVKLITNKSQLRCASKREEWHAGTDLNFYPKSKEIIKNTLFAISNAQEALEWISNQRSQDLNYMWASGESHKETRQKFTASQTQEKGISHGVIIWKNSQTNQTNSRWHRGKTQFTRRHNLEKLHEAESFLRN
jgi:hypothetical protein